MSSWTIPCPPATTILRRLVLASAVLCIDRPVVAQPQVPAIVMRIYDSAALPSAVASELRAATEAALAPTGITIDWRACADDNPTKHVACATPQSRREIVVRMVDSHALVGARHCGFALRTSGGGFISLSRACALRAASYLERRREPGQPPIATEGEILGYTLAHELAHVLLPGSPHSTSGVFAGRLHRAHWRRMRSGLLSFLPRDVARLREAAIIWCRGST